MLTNRLLIDEHNREAGANPARSRHCKEDGPQTMSLAVMLLGRPEAPDEPESGDLPVLNLQDAHGVWARIRI